MDFARKLSFLIFLLCVLISFNNRKAETNRYPTPRLQGAQRIELAGNGNADVSPAVSLRYDYYSDSCPLAEKIIRSSVRSLFNRQPSVAPALIRLFFHDCFVQGCDASVLLDKIEGVNGTEKSAIPNISLKGFDEIDLIKSELEETCPGIVSCADIIVLAARDGVHLVGGLFYPVFTGRKDSITSTAQEAYNQLPSPQDDLVRILDSFSRKGFDARETVSLLGAHSTGTIHCKFFKDRLYNFKGSNGPDPSLDTKFLDLLRSTCNTVYSSSPSPSVSPSPSAAENSPSDQGMKMDYEGPGKSFGTLYYRSLLQGRGLLYADQQLTSGEETESWVRQYVSDTTLFQRDFGRAMIKLSNLRNATPSMGQVRLNCRKLN